MPSTYIYKTVCKSVCIRARTPRRLASGDVIEAHSERPRGHERMRCERRCRPSAWRRERGLSQSESVLGANMHDLLMRTAGAKVLEMIQTDNLCRVWARDVREIALVPALAARVQICRHVREGAVHLGIRHKNPSDDAGLARPAPEPRLLLPHQVKLLLQHRRRAVDPDLPQVAQEQPFMRENALPSELTIPSHTRSAKWKPLIIGKIDSLSDIVAGVESAVVPTGECDDAAALLLHRLVHANAMSHQGRGVEHRH